MKLAKTEINLVGLCRKGDTKAQYKLYKLYSKAMYNIAVRMVGDNHLAEDILQEAFIKAFMEIGKLKNDFAFRGWLKRIVLNLCIDHLRKEKLVFTELEEIREMKVDTVEIDIIVDPALVHRMIKKLPEGARQILVMRAIEGYKHTEIGEELGISESTVKTQFFRAKQLLGKMINEENNETGSGKISEGKKVTA